MTGRNKQLYIALILAFIVLGVVLDQLGYLTPLRPLIHTGLVPLQKGITSLSQGMANRAEAVESIEAIRSQNEELQARLNQLMVENVQLRELERENQQLRQLLNYTRTNPQFSYQPTGVIGRKVGVDPTNLVYLLYVDVGSWDGIARNMPVITDRGLVGRVSAVGPRSAQVLLLIDPASAVNAIVQNSRATGLVRGNLDGTLVMERIRPDEDVNPGDIVLTSGLGGNFPARLVIGQVTEVTHRDQDMTQTARLRPTVDFGKLETVLILTSFEPVDFETDISQEAAD